MTQLKIRRAFLIFSFPKKLFISSKRKIQFALYFSLNSISISNFNSSFASSHQQKISKTNKRWQFEHPSQKKYQIFHQRKVLISKINLSSNSFLYRLLPMLKYQKLSRINGYNFPEWIFCCFLGLYVPSSIFKNYGCVFKK